MNISEAILTLNSIKKTVLTPTEEAPRPSAAGTSQYPVGISRVRDRQNAAVAQHEIVPQTPAYVPDAWEKAHYRREAEEKESRTKQGNIRLERERVAEAHRIDDIRRREDAEARNKQANDHFQAELLRAEIKGIMRENLDIVSEVHALVKSWRMEKFAPAWATAVAEVRKQKE